MLKIEIDPDSVGLVRKNSKRFNKRFRAVANKSLISMTDILKKKILQNMSRRDHSLKDLQEMDHPYAARHGRILTGKLGMPFNNNMSYLIHQRSGSLKKDLRVKKDKSDGTAEFYFDTDRGAVITGTKHMLPRDVISGTANEKVVQKKMMSVATKNFKKLVKSYGK